MLEMEAAMEVLDRAVVAAPVGIPVTVVQVFAAHTDLGEMVLQGLAAVVVAAPLVMGALVFVHPFVTQAPAVAVVLDCLGKELAEVADLGLAGMPVNMVKEMGAAEALAGRQVKLGVQLAADMVALAALTVAEAA